MKSLFKEKINKLYSLNNYYTFFNINKTYSIKTV